MRPYVAYMSKWIVSSTGWSLFQCQAMMVYFLIVCVCLHNIDPVKVLSALFQYNANERIYHGPKDVFTWWHITLSHCHCYAVIWTNWTHNCLSDIFCQVRVLGKVYPLHYPLCDICCCVLSNGHVPFVYYENIQYHHKISNTIHTRVSYTHHVCVNKWCKHIAIPA